jgi:hypothetical protein
LDYRTGRAFGLMQNADAGPSQAYRGGDQTEREIWITGPVELLALCRTQTPVRAKPTGGGDQTETEIWITGPVELLALCRTQTPVRLLTAPLSAFSSSHEAVRNAFKEYGVAVRVGWVGGREGRVNRLRTGSCCSPLPLYYSSLSSLSPSCIVRGREKN